MTLGMRHNAVAVPRQNARPRPETKLHFLLSGMDNYQLPAPLSISLIDRVTQNCSRAT
jgi:hypothetical protein